MNIIGIESITYGAADVDAAIRYMEDAGLTAREKGATGADLALQDGTSIHIRRAEDTSLKPALIDWAHLNDSTAREVVWGVDSQATLDAIAAELGKDRDVTADNHGTLHSTDDYGYALGFCITRRHTEPQSLPETNTVGRVGRRNRPADGTVRGRAEPWRMGHVVYWAPGDTREKVRFYTERLGFRETDRMANGNTFLRCAGSNDHHTLLLQNGGDYLGFQHVAFEYRDFDTVMMLGNHMEEQGWRTNVGPLRHTVGGSMSWYLWTPAGGMTEAYCDMDWVDDDWQPRDINPRDPSFYGHSWNARPDQTGRRPADLHADMDPPPAG